MNTFESLIGKNIEGVLISDDKKTLIFCLYDGTTEVFRSVGGCCSDSWIEHIEGVEALLETFPRYGQKPKVLSTEEIEQKTVIENDHEVTKAYGYKITTDKGMIQIEMRNESNGYYGGEMVRGFKEQYHEFDKDENYRLTALLKDF